MNQTQLPAGLASLVAFGAGILAGRGVFGFDVATWTAILGAVIGLGATVWAAIATRKTAIVSAVGALAQVPGSGVNGVITSATAEGRELAAAIPAATVATAGTADANQIAKPK